MTHTLNDTELTADCDAFLGFLDGEAIMCEYFWTKKKYDEYVDYLECYNRNRHAWRDPAVIDNFDDWYTANQEEIEQKYDELLSTSDES